MLLKLLGIIALLAVGHTTAQAGPQAAFSTHGDTLDEKAHVLHLNASKNYVETMHLSAIRSTEEYTVLKHAKHPGHSVRVKKTDFCDSTVKYVHLTLFIILQATGKADLRAFSAAVQRVYRISGR